MSVSTITTAINAYINTNYSSTSVAYANAKFDTLSVTEFVRLNIVFGSSGQKTMGGGGNVYRQLGRVVFQIFTELDKGSLRGMTLSDELATLFRSKRISTIQFATPDTNVVGDTEDGFFLITTAIDFYDDTIITVPL